MSTRSNGKDVQQKKSSKKRRGTEPQTTKDAMLEQKQVKARKVSQKDHDDMDEKARQEEKQLKAVSAATVLVRLDDDRQEDKKSKRERRKSEASTHPEEPDHVEVSANHDKEKKKGDSPVTNSTDGSKRKKKDKDKDATDSGGGQGFSSVPEIRDGKTKKSSSKRKLADCNADEVPDKDQQCPKKKHKKSKIVNPKKDECLSEQALKALTYAYSQYRHPEKWKFNKARQNWITRNVWSANMIPEQHLPLVTWYLKSVKGGVRDALTEKCQSHVQLSITTESVPSESTPTPLFGLTADALGKHSENAAETKRSRAQILLEALQAP